MLIKQLKPQPARGTFQESLWEDPGWVAEKKENGARYLGHFNQDRVYFTSRRISKKTGLFSEKGENVPHLNASCPALLGTVLDGEMIDSSEKVYGVMSVMGSLPDIAIQKQKADGFVTWVIWDVLFYKEEDVRQKPLVFRRDLLEKIYMEHLKGNAYIQLEKQFILGKKAYYNWLINQGGEGIILKNLQHIYGDESGWVKVKKTETEDVIIIGYNEPSQTSKKVTGEVSPTRFALQGWIGSLMLGVFKNGVLVEVGNCSGMDDTMRKEFSLNKDKYLGHVIEIRCQEVLPSGKYQNPEFVRLRPDKNAKDCIWKGQDTPFT